MNTKIQFHLIKNFFVISPDELDQFYYDIRRNVLALVHYGFSREEVYFMPAGEVIDYVKIINDEKQKEREEIAALQAQNNVDNKSDINMAGNTLPGSIL